MTRKNSKTWLIGQSRTGKSVTALKIAEKIKETNGESVIVFDPQGRFKDICTHRIMSQKDLSDFIIKDEVKKEQSLTVKNGLLIIDETPSFFIRGQVTEETLIFISLCGEYNIEVLLICHAPTQLQPQIASNITHLCVFACGASKKNFDTDKIQNNETAKAALSVVLEYLYHHKKGDDGLGVYPDFPYAHIDLLENKVHFANMPEIKIKEIKEKNEVFKTVEITK